MMTRPGGAGAGRRLATIFPLFLLASWSVDTTAAATQSLPRYRQDRLGFLAPTSSLYPVQLLPPMQRWPHGDRRHPPLPLPAATTTTTTAVGRRQRRLVVTGGYRASESSRQSEEVIDVSGDGGVTKRILRPGYGYQQGPPPQYAYVKVAFVMKTETGQVIADRLNRPMEFMIGLENPEVIPGWELAVPTMKNNEIAEVTCASGYAFGASGYKDKIPPNVSIITRLQLLSWRSIKSSASTDIQDTEELSRKWREELDEGISPINTWANTRAAEATLRQQQQDGRAGAKEGNDYQPSTLNDTPPPRSPPPFSSSQSPPPPGVGWSAAAAAAGEQPLVQEMTEADSPRKVDLDDLTRRKKLNPHQVVIGKAPQYRWKERQDYLELYLPVPDDVRKGDVLFHLTPRKLLLGYKEGEGKENWVIGGDLFGPVEVGSSFWVLSRGGEEEEELTGGATCCIEVRLEKKEGPLKRIWATVFSEEDEEEQQQQGGGGPYSSQEEQN